MSLICHLPTFVSTADLTGSIREASLREMFNSLEVAADLGAQKVVLHPGHIGGLGLYVKETVMALANKSLVSIIGRAQELGLRICLENMFPKCGAFFEPDDFEDILQQFPDLRLTLDTGHANIDGRGGRRTLDFIEKFGPRIGHLHISDNSGERDDHIPVGAGVIDFLKLFMRLNNVDTTIPLRWKYFQMTAERRKTAEIGLRRCLSKLENSIYPPYSFVMMRFEIST